MSDRLAIVAGWAVFLAAAAILISACSFSVQIYNFNQFALLLLVVPAVVLLLLRHIHGRAVTRQSSD